MFYVVETDGEVFGMLVAIMTEPNKPEKWKPDPLALAIIFARLCKILGVIFGVSGGIIFMYGAGLPDGEAYMPWSQAAIERAVVLLFFGFVVDTLCALVEDRRKEK